MGDDERGAVLHQAVHALFNQALGAGVDGAGGLVQHQNRSLAQRRAGNVEQLALALRQVRAVALDHGVVAVGQALDEAVGAGGLRGFDDLFVGGVEAAVADVLHDGAAEQVGILQDHGDVLSQHVALDVLDVDAVDGDRAGINVIEAVEQVGNGGLACAGGADEGDLLAGLCVQGDVLQHGLLGHIAEGDVVEDDVALDFGGEGVRGVGLLGVDVHDAEHALCAGEGGEDGVGLLGKLVDGAGELAGVVDEHGEAADVKASQRAQHAADAGGQRVADLAGVAHDGAHQAAEEHGAHLLAAQVVVETAELLFADFLVAEDLDDLLAGDVFLDVAVDCAEGCLLRGVVLAVDLHQHAAALGEDRDEGERDQREPYVGVQHQRQRHHQRDAAGDQRGDGGVQHHADVVHVVGEAAHDFAGALVVIEAHGQLLDFFVQIVADLFDGAAGNHQHHALLRVGAQHADHVDQREYAHHQHEIGHALGGGGCAVGDVVDDGAQQIGRREGCAGVHQHADEGGDDALPVDGDVGEDAQDGALGVLGLAAHHAAGAGASAGTASAGAARTSAGCGGIAETAVALGEIFKTSSGHYAPSFFSI